MQKLLNLTVAGDIEKHTDVRTNLPLRTVGTASFNQGVTVQAAG